MTGDLFARPDRPCPECGAREGAHYIDCSILADELEEKHGVCPACWTTRPCVCEAPHV